MGRFQTREQLKQAIRCGVLAAGTNALKSRNRTAKFKSARDLVTTVDKENERLIIKNVRLFDRSISVWGEEGGKDTRDTSRIVIIDPLDATTNFAKGIVFYSIMAVYYENGVPEYAIIYLPRFDEIFTAERGKGAFLNDNRIRTSQVAELSQAVISCNRSNYPPELVPVGERLISALLKPGNSLSWRNFGTAGVEYSYTSAGIIDAVVTPLAEAVHAAGYLVMQEAGCKVTDHLGRPINLESPSVVAANPALHEKLLGLVQPAFVQ